MEATPEVQARVANALNCKQGFFPFTYLGFPIADRQLSISDWKGLVSKVGHRVDPWQGRFMSSAARLTLINSSLSSLTLYAMGLFLLADGIHASFDKILARFFWERTRQVLPCELRLCVDVVLNLCFALMAALLI
jgi:hypothetical protein